MAEKNAEEFAGRVLRDMSGLASVFMAGLGDRLGLFKDLHEHGAATSSELAARSHTDERYVREWLAGMTSCGYLTYDPAGHSYSLPPEHAPALAEENGPMFFGGALQMVTAMLDVMDGVQKSFRDGGGVPMSAYNPNCWDGNERDMACVYEANLFDVWLPALPEIQAMLEEGVKVADVGCGRGYALIRLAQRYPRSTFTGYDVYEPNMEIATERAVSAGVADRVTFETLDASGGLPARFDIITTFDVVHDAPDPVGLLRSIYTALLPGGRYMCMDVNCAETPEENNEPLDTLRYAFSLLYCMTTSLHAGGVGLGTLGLTPSLMRQFCSEAGFSSFRLVPLENSNHNLYEALK